MLFCIPVFNDLQAIFSCSETYFVHFQGILTKTHSLPDIVRSTKAPSVRDDMAVLSFSRTSLLTSDLDKATMNPAARDTGDCGTADTSREGTDVVGDLEHQQRSREEGELCNRRYRL